MAGATQPCHVGNRCLNVAGYLLGCVTHHQGVVCISRPLFGLDIQAVSAVAAAFGRSILRLLLSFFGTDGWHNHVASSCASGLLWSSPLVTGERAQWTTQRRRVMHIVECIITPIATVLDSVMHHAVFFKWYANVWRPWIHWLLQMNHLDWRLMV